MSDREPEAMLCEGSLPSPASFEFASPAMRAFGRLLVSAASHAVPVLLLGERGTGTTTFGRALHAMSPRAKKPFVRVDCLAATGDLSHEVRKAKGGTLFLDGIGALPPATQAAALGLLQNARRPRWRLVASTHEDLLRAATAGRFRQDLYYRLNVLEIRVPPLRERIEDILPLARAHLASLSRAEGRPCPDFSPEFQRALLAYAWPGNVQELLSTIQRAFILSPPGEPLDARTLSERFSAALSSWGD